MLTTEQHAKLIECADAHRVADEYIAGHYEDGTGKGCAIGCAIMDCQRLGVLDATVSRDDHAALAEATGIPELALRLEDHIFEGLPAAERTAWPSRFLRSFKPGADYSRFAASVMARLAARLADDAVRDYVRDVAQALAALWTRRAEGDEPAEDELKAAMQQAVAARRQAHPAWQQSYAAWHKSEVWRAYAAWHKSEVWRQVEAVWHQANAARRQDDAAWHQAEAARQLAYAAWPKFWRWCADVVCEELSRE